MSQYFAAVATVCATMFTLLVSPAGAATYYVGSFSKCNGQACPTAVDDASCGAAHPCKTLAYWTQNKANGLASGDVVRLTGTLGPSANANHCIVPNIAGGATYEGRKADDTQATDYSSAIVDVGATPNANPCWGSGFRRNNQGGGSLANFKLRYLTIQNAQTAGIVAAPKDAIFSGFTIDHVRVTKSAAEGIWVGPAWDVEDVPCNNNYSMVDVHITDSQADQNGHYGIWLACVGGRSILERSKTFHNCDFDKQGANCSACVQSSSCVSDDGMHIVAAGTSSVPVLIQDNESYENGEDNLDVSGNGYALCDAPSHHVVVQRNNVHDSWVKGNILVNHCNHDITIRNNFVWGRGMGLEGYECPWNIQVYNNTFWMSGTNAISLWEGNMYWDIENNIIRTQNSDGSNAPVRIERASANSTHRWVNNAIISASGGVNIAMNNGVRTSSAPFGCQATGDSHGFSCPACPANDPQFYCYMSGKSCPAPRSDATLSFFPLAANSSGYDSFKTSCSTGKLFDSTTCKSDATWGQTPALVNPGAPKPENLALSGTDTVALGKGVTIASVVDDFFGVARVAGNYSIGASEPGGQAGVNPPLLLSVDPLP